MATDKIRVGIIGASMRNGWGRDAHIPALSALPEFEITAVSTSRQETADETAKHFGIPHAFADPYKMVQHPHWTLSRFAGGCLFTISWGLLL
jgi:predicted dehydrogenase